MRGIIVFMNSFKNFLKENVSGVITVAVVAIVLVAGGYFAGFKNGARESAVTFSASGEKIQADYDVYWQAWKTLRDNHVDGAGKTDKDMMYSSIQGLSQTYGDPHTMFFPPDEGKKFEEDVSGSFGGIGAEIGEKDGVINVVAPLKDSPSERAGLEAGDLIFKINETSTEGLSVNKAVSLIRGTIGTSVKLNVFRKEKWLQPRDITIVRDEIKLPTLDISYKGGDVAYVQLYAFNQNSESKFRSAMTSALAKGSKGLVLDLRNNPGGYLDVAVGLAGWFVDRGTLVVSERFRSGPDQQLFASGNGALKKMPVVVLINRGSASASEILAGMLRDQRGAKIIGETSYGKGTVQEIMHLKDDSSLKVTIAHWVMPKGQVLDHNGIKPDIEVLPSDEDLKNKKDVQLEKALEVIKSEIDSKTLAGQ